MSKVLNRRRQRELIMAVGILVGFTLLMVILAWLL